MPPDHDKYVDDDALLERAGRQINEWKSLPDPPSLTSVQHFFHELIRDGGSKMLRDRVIGAIMVVFNTELGGRRALTSTWTQIEKDVAPGRAQAARERPDDELPAPTAEQKEVLRADLWPKICVLAEAQDLLERIVRQVQSLGVVNENELTQE
jgi:hypothetical protein